MDLRDEKTKSFRTFSRERAEQIKGRLENAALEITSVEKKQKRLWPRACTT